MAKLIRSHRDLEVYQRAFDCAMTVFKLSSEFPREERYSLTDQMRRSSRSVAANIAEAWRKRRYEASFVSRITDAEAEAAETQVWLEFGVKCRYLNRTDAAELYRAYEAILGTLVGMVAHSDKWTSVKRK
jgi:four helix bundle protein